MVYSNKILRSLARWLALILPACALLYASGLFFLHIMDRIAWPRYYSTVTNLGSSCRYSIGTWPGSFETALEEQKMAKWADFAMPHRGKERPPRAFRNDYLATECFIDAGIITETSKPHVNLGPLYGGSRIYMDGAFVREVDDGGEGAFDIPRTQVRSGRMSILVISRGFEDGSVGMASLRPPYLSLSSDQEILIKRFKSATFTEHPTFRVGLLTLLLIVLFIVRRSGLAHSDITWMLNWCGGILLANAVLYGFQFDSALQGPLERSLGALNLISYICMCGYFHAYVFRDRLKAGIALIAYVLGGVYTASIFLVSDKVFFDLRMMTRLPGLIGALIMALSFIAFAGVRFWKKTDTGISKDAAWLQRLHYGMASSALAMVALFGQTYLDEHRGIYIDAILQVLLLGGHFLYLAWGMGARQKDYFAERRLRMAEQERNLWAKTVADAARFIAHDLQRPFAILTEFVQQIDHKNGQNMAALVQSFSTAIHHAEREASTLIGDLIQLNSDQVDRLSVVPLRSVVEDARERTIKMFPDSRIEISSGTFDDAVCDRRSLTRVLQNIFVNAIQASGVECQITVGTQRTSESICVLKIHNTGSYIDEEKRRRIFDLGFTSGKKSGSGLGLTYAAQVLSQCGGTISCESDKLTGTTFYLEIPCVSIDSSNSSRKFESIAIVDDDLFVGVAWRQRLSDTKVDHFASPTDFIAGLKGKSRNAYQVVILDFNFDNFAETGLDLARMIKNFNPEIITVLSTSQEMRASDLNDGVVDLVIEKKVLSLAQLGDLCGNLSEKKSYRRSS